MRNFYPTKIACVWVLLFCSSWAFAQTRVSGRVTSADDGTGLPGVSILEKGTTNGTVTDSDGNYTITASSEGTLIFSFVGYTSQEMSVANASTINVSLVSDITELGEIVVLGYGTQEKKDVTGSVVSLSTKEFNRGVVTAPQQLLIGKVAGVQITTAGGAPGANATIRIRGGASLNASNDPLIVIDGFPVDNNTMAGNSNPLSTINPNDIESINVLKDASATAIFGSRASNGVIIITTKKGKAGKLKLNYSGNYSISKPIEYVDVLNGDEYRALVNKLNEEGYPGINDAAVDLLGEENTDWQKEVFRTSFSHDHNINASGSIKNTMYRVSYGYTDSEGILKNTDLQRNSLNINVNPSFLDGALNINAGLKGSFTKNNYGNEGAVGAALAFDPTQKVRSSDPLFDQTGGYFAWLDKNTGRPLTNVGSNPVAMINQTDNRSEVYRAIGTLQVDYAIPFISGLKANLSTGFDIAKGEGHDNHVKTAAFSLGGPGRISTYTSDNRSQLFDFYLNYQKDIDKHKFDATAGYSYQRFTRDGSSFIRNADGIKFTTYDINAAGDTVALQNTPNPNVLISVFGRLNYNYDDRYLITASVRNDQSSRFSPSTRSGWFPAIALGWRINNEMFLQAAEKLSELKLRLGYGITGQQDIGSTYPYLALFSRGTETARYQLGDAYYTTFRPNGFDPKIKWEETTTYNVGVDVGFLENRITASLDVYRRETRDLLNEVNVPAGSNLTTRLFTNVGEMTNEGVEITFNYKVFDKQDFSWTIGANMTYNQNEITRLTRAENAETQGQLTGGISGGVGNNVQVQQVGHPINSFYVFEQIFDETGRPIEGLYVDHTGLGGSVTSNNANRIIYKSPTPEYLIGLNSSVNYKKFDFSFSGRLSLGNYVYNNILSDRARYSNILNTSGALNNVPAAITDTEFQNPQYLSSYYVEDGSFFKMDYISAGYSFDGFDNKFKGRVGFTVNTAFMITDYKGIDPEISNGIDNNIYPRPRVFMLSLNLTY